jgi:hypothetical protein
MSNIKERLAQVLPRITKEPLLGNCGRGGEIGFYIFDYNPADELIVRDYLQYLLRQLPVADSRIKPVESDLYLLMFELLERKKVLGRVEQLEQREGRARLHNALKSVLQPEDVIQLIKEQSAGANLVLLTGVGKVWPFIRSHTVLNNLYHVLDTIPVIMFFPGVYNQRELKLFNKFKDDNYYRAFKLIADAGEV